MSKPYSEFSTIYDWVMDGVQYEMWADYVTGLAARHGVIGRNVLDIACGTGNTSFTMAKRGYRVTGLDISERMLAVARRKARDLGLLDETRFVQADMRCFNIQAKYDLITCLYDSVNYLLTIEDIQKAFSCAGRHLKPHGIYVFDVNTIAQLAKTGRRSPTLLEKEDDIALFWQDEWCPFHKIWRVTLNGFVKQGDSYSRFREVHEERAYSIDELEQALFSSGFSRVNVYDAFTEAPPRHDSSRLHFVCRL